MRACVRICADRAAGVKEAGELSSGEEIVVVDVEAVEHLRAATKELLREHAVCDGCVWFVVVYERESLCEVCVCVCVCVCGVVCEKSVLLRVARGSTASRRRLSPPPLTKARIELVTVPST